MTRFDVLAESDESENEETRTWPTPGRQSTGASRPALIWDEAMLLHCASGPETPDRVAAIMHHLASTDIVTACDQVPPRRCSKEDALLVHTEAHWERMMDLPHAPLGAASMCSNDHTADAARLAAGSVVEATELVCAGISPSAFAVVRPPGHHANHSSMQGFCFLNNVAIAARVAQKRHKLKRILVLDWDVHHGNGTEALLAEDSGIMYMSLHRLTKQFYPNTGHLTSVGDGPGEGFTVNIPWRRVGMGDWEYMYAFEKIVMPIACQFDPQLVLVSAGYDASKGDPLGEMELTAGCYAYMTSQLQKLAGGRVVCALEGGYRNKPTAKGVGATLRQLAHLEDVPWPACTSPPEEKDRVWRSCVQTVHDVCRTQSRYWGILRAQTHNLHQPSMRLSTDEDDEVHHGVLASAPAVAMGPLVSPEGANDHGNKTGEGVVRKKKPRAHRRRRPKEDVVTVAVGEAAGEGND